jgi:hypothetical protein
VVMEICYAFLKLQALGFFDIVASSRHLTIHQIIECIATNVQTISREIFLYIAMVSGSHSLDLYYYLLVEFPRACPAVPY